MDLTCPIRLATLHHTGREDGDDSGYRDVAVEENGERLVVINELVRTAPVYATGVVKGLCPYYGQGLGSDPRILVRESVLGGLYRANQLLAPYNRELVVVDGWRSLGVQAALWVDLFERILVRERLSLLDLSLFQLVKFGLEADGIGSYAPVQVNSEEYREYLTSARSTPTVSDQALEAAIKLGKSLDEVLHLWITFNANLMKGESVPFDESGNTAHGAGGATDLYLWDTKAEQFTCLGVPFDYAKKESRMDYFEDSRNRGPFIQLVREQQDLLLSQYINECFGRTFGRVEWESIQHERRLLYHACVNAGASIYNLEPWHFNWGNSQAKYSGAGGSCHSILKNIRSKSGEYIAIWGNADAHRQARELIAV